LRSFECKPPSRIDQRPASNVDHGRNATTFRSSSRNAGAAVVRLRRGLSQNPGQTSTLIRTLSSSRTVDLSGREGRKRHGHSVHVLNPPAPQCPQPSRGIFPVWCPPSPRPAWVSNCCKVGAAPYLPPAAISCRTVLDAMNSCICSPMVGLAACTRDPLTGVRPMAQAVADRCKLPIGTPFRRIRVPLRSR
jgi:hypothetical protein